MLEKTFQPEAIEDKQYKEWESSGQFSCAPESNQAPFTVMMPPPNVTGSLHMGHALNTTLQDVLTRYYRRKGRDALWQPGTDHAGIATQMVVERRLEKEGVHRRDLGREKFLEKVWEWKEQSGNTITVQLRRIGATPDWPRERFTMDEGLSLAVRKVFVQLYKEGLIYRDKRLVNWDPHLHTAISDLEVEQRDVKGHMWHIAYPIEGEEARSITVATTRPETMLGDTAVAVHPGDLRYQDLIGKYAMLPLTGRLIPIIADEHADPEQGSGAVKITPAHDFNDFEVGKRHDLPMINIFDDNARINENAPEEFQGMDRFEARKKIVKMLDEEDYLVSIEDHALVMPYGDRSGVVIEPYLTDQWFVDAATLAKPAIEAVETGKTVFIPKQWENTYLQWMRNIQPWCISRQLWWGHQIPAWFGPEGSIFVEESEEEAYAAARAQFGEDVEITRDEDVLDTWFSSALWPFSTLGWPEKTRELDKYYPGDVLVTGFDIIPFWVARMMMFGIHFMGDIPFREVYIHALVRDSKGQKMSKSKGNVIDPLDLINRYGADSLRFTLSAMAVQGRDLKLSEERVEGYRNFATKLWNAARYCEMNRRIFDPDFKVESTQYAPNLWIASETAKTKEAIETALSQYRFNDAAEAIYHFTWGAFCDWYLEFTKPVLTNAADEDPIAIETRKTMGWALAQILSLLNPFMPYITEELYATIANGDTSLLKTEWPEYAPELVNEPAQTEIGWLIRLITEIRSLRADMNIPNSARIRAVLKDLNEENAARLSKYKKTIENMARLESIEQASSAPEGSVQTVLDEAFIILPVADVIDLDKERARLKKEIEKLQGEVKKLESKLSNESFTAKAPEDVVAEQRRRLEETQATLNKLSSALKQLEAA